MKDRQGKLYGCYCEIKGKATKRKIKKAKKYVLKQIIRVVKIVAKDEPEFFIIKNRIDGNMLSCNTVGAKILLPTLKGVD